MLVLLKMDLSKEVKVFPERGGLSVVELELHFDCFCCNIDGFMVKGSLSAVKLGKNAIDGHENGMNVA